MTASNGFVAMLSPLIVILRKRRQSGHLIKSASVGQKGEASVIRIFSVGIRSIPHLEAFLGSSVGFGLATEAKQRVVAVAGWGLRASAVKAIRYARNMKLPYLALEDGFCVQWTWDPRNHRCPSSSMTLDLLRCSCASRLEVLIGMKLSPDKAQRARQVVAHLREGRVSKYNHQREYRRLCPMNLAPSITDRVSDRIEEHHIKRRYVLAVDQTMGDASIKYGQAGPSSFRRMLTAALAENPECTVVVKSHPDVWAGNKRGHFDLTEISRHQSMRY